MPNCKFESNSNERCVNYARFGQPDVKTPVMCKLHKRDGDVPKGKLLCQTDNCNKAGRFSDPEDRSQVRCGKHKLISDHNFGNDVCKAPGCQISASYGSVGCKPEWCKKHSKVSNVVLKNALCVIENCIKKASFGVIGSNKKTHCSTHKLENSENMLNKYNKCTFPGCNTTSNFSVSKTSNVRHCAAHKTPEEFQIFGRRCDKCDRFASWKTTSQTNEVQNFCSKCRPENAQTILRRYLCTFEGCKLHASFGATIGELKFCSKHKSDSDVGGAKMCETIGCQKQVQVRKPGSKMRTHCLLHKPEGSICNKRICSEKDCSLGANFGIEKSKPITCEKHKTESYWNVVRKHCQIENCKITAKYNYLFEQAVFCNQHKKPGMLPNEKRNPKCLGCSKARPMYTDQANNIPLRCESCKIDGDVNIVEKKCQHCGLASFIKSSNTLCDDCHTYASTRFQKSREIMVKAILDSNKILYESHDKIPEDACGTRYRPDFYFDLGTHILILEVDENGHKRSNYTPFCEFSRMVNLSQLNGGMKTIFLRLNPDMFTDNCGIKNKWSTKREKIFIKLLRELSKEIPEFQVSVCYLFYDGQAENDAQVKKLTAPPGYEEYDKMLEAVSGTC